MKLLYQYQNGLSEPVAFNGGYTMKRRIRDNVKEFRRIRDNLEKYEMILKNLEEYETIPKNL